VVNCGEIHTALVLDGKSIGSNFKNRAQKRAHDLKNQDAS